MTINRRLKAARVAQGLTQLQLAEKVGKKEIEVSRYETGRAVPDAATADRIAAALGCKRIEIGLTPYGGNGVTA